MTTSAAVRASLTSKNREWRRHRDKLRRRDTAAAARRLVRRSVDAGAQ